MFDVILYLVLLLNAAPISFFSICKTDFCHRGDWIITIHNITQLHHSFHYSLKEVVRETLVYIYSILLTVSLCNL